MLRRIWAAVAAVMFVFISGLAGCTNAVISARPTHLASTNPTDEATEAASVSHLSGIAAMIGVDLGAGSGYLIGAAPDKIQQKQGVEARAAAERSRLTPATVEDARRADTADLNGDGFVTLDEIVAMQKAGFSDPQMIDRIQRTGQVFILTDQQQDYLGDRGVSQPVIDAMIAMGLRCSPTAGSTTTPKNANGR
jgi:hypothetical protein